MRNLKLSTAGLGIAFTLLLSGCMTPAEVIDADVLARDLMAGDRAEADKKRDAGRKPAEVLAFLGVKPGMTAMDVLAAGGYYTEVLSKAVGPKGTVYAHNPAWMLQFRDGANDKAITSRLAGNRLPNVKRWDRGIQNLGMDPASVDIAITALNLHDLYNRAPESALGLLRSIKEVLKSGGVLGVIDHRGNSDADNSGLHRMTEAEAIDIAIQAGFKVESSSLLANSNDDRTSMVFAPGIRGKTDRFLLKLVNP